MESLWLLTRYEHVCSLLCLMQALLSHIQAQLIGVSRGRDCSLLTYGNVTAINWNMIGKKTLTQDYLTPSQVVILCALSLQTFSWSFIHVLVQRFSRWKTLTGSNKCWETSSLDASRTPSTRLANLSNEESLQATQTNIYIYSFTISLWLEVYTSN